MGRVRSSTGGHGERLTAAFFARPAVEVAPDLLGCSITHRTNEGPVTVRLTEVEAYAGTGDDAASHAHHGRTRRNETMFGDAGSLYVYFTYGMHWCANLVCLARGKASAVLLRAGEVTEGRDLARTRRPKARGGTELASGPARLTTALGIDGALDGVDVLSRHGPLTIVAGPQPQDVESGPRVGISRATELPWRFWIADEPTVSRFRPGKPRATR